MARTPAFDRNEVVDKALDVFWRQGYGQTSVCDLVDATGLQPGSLYAAFGNKKGVFLEVLDTYNRAFVDRIRALGRDGRPALDGIRDLLAGIVEATVSGQGQQGCLAVNALLELAAHEPDVARRLSEHNERVRGSFAAVIARAQDLGEIAPGRSPEALSAFLVNNLWGMRVTCRGCTDRATLDAVVDGILDALTHRA